MSLPRVHVTVHVFFWKFGFQKPIFYRLSSIVYRLSSIVYRLSSIVYRPSSIVHRLCFSIWPRLQLVAYFYGVVTTFWRHPSVIRVHTHGQINLFLKSQTSKRTILSHILFTVVCVFWKCSQKGLNCIKSYKQCCFSNIFFVFSLKLYFNQLFLNHL